MVRFEFSWHNSVIFFLRFPFSNFWNNVATAVRPVYDGGRPLWSLGSKFWGLEAREQCCGLKLEREFQ